MPPRRRRAHEVFDRRSGAHVAGCAAGDDLLVEMADDRAKGLKNQFIMDMHTHFLRDDTRLVWVETPTNPTLKVIDVPGVVARARGAFVAVDMEWEVACAPPPGLELRRK